MSSTEDTPGIFEIAVSTLSASSSSESAIVMISAFNPNAMGSSLASLKTPDSKDSTVFFISVLSSSRSVSILSGIILNCIPAVAILFLRSLVSAFWTFIFN